MVEETVTANSGGMQFSVLVDIEALPKDLCVGWPAAKKFLEALSSILKGPWAPIYQAAIALIIAVGDKACAKSHG